MFENLKASPLWVQAHTEIQVREEIERGFFHHLSCAKVYMNGMYRVFKGKRLEKAYLHFAPCCASGSASQQMGTGENIRLLAALLEAEECLKLNGFIDFETISIFEDHKGSIPASYGGMDPLLTEAYEELCLTARERAAKWALDPSALKLLEIAAAVEHLQWTSCFTLSRFEGLIPQTLEEYFEKEGVSSPDREIAKAKLAEVSRTEGSFLVSSNYSFLTDSSLLDTALTRFKVKSSLGRDVYLIPARFAGVLNDSAVNKLLLKPDDTQVVAETAAVFHSDGMGLSEALNAARSI